MDGYCSHCHKPCWEVERDFGYGVTEYWGSISNHSNWQKVSECCDGDVVQTLEELEDGTEA